MSVSHSDSSSQALYFVAATVQQQSHIKLFLLWRLDGASVCACLCQCIMSVSRRAFKLSGRVLTLFDVVEPEGTERGCSWPFVPFLGKTSCLGPSRIFGSASQITTNDNLLRVPQHSNSVMVRKTCPPPSTVMSISIKQGFICGRSVGPFGRAVRSGRSILLNKKKRSNTCTSSS